MNFKSIRLLSICVILIILGSCARRGNPTGGPKDTIPPNLVQMNPALGAVNFSDNQLELTFNEFIQARDLKKELIVNPTVKDYTFFASKRRLVIQLEENLKDSTTYTFNFREGIKDISEGNSAKNITLAFSTGSQLDSFQVAGQVKHLLTGKPVENAVVGLYPADDTIDVFTGPPMYFTETNKEGDYQINYIKQGEYDIYAFNDQNNNLKYESNNEAIGFKAKPVTLKPDSVKILMRKDSADSVTTDSVSANMNMQLYGANINLPLIKKDVRPIKIQSNRPNGMYYEVKFNKSLKEYNLFTEESDISEKTKQYVEDSLNANIRDSTTNYVFSNLQDQQQLIRIYNTLKQDSLRVFLTASDSINQQIEDTVLYVRFSSTRRKPEEFTQQFKPEQSEITNSIKAELSFSKPVIRVKTDSVLLVYDTLFSLPLDYTKLFTWNEQYDKVNIQTEIQKEALIKQVIAGKKRSDSIAFNRRIQLEKQYIDSLRKEKDLEKRIDYLEQLTMLQNDPAKKVLVDSISNVENDEAKLKLLSEISDTVSVTKNFIAPRYTRETIMANMEPLTLYMAPGSFISVEQDSSKEVRQSFTFKNPENYGTIKGKIETEYPSYIIQLLDKDFKVIAESRSRGTYSFRLIKPGTYQIRILIDQNEDGQWDSGNLLENREPEPVIFYKEGEIKLNSNWEMTMNLSF